MISLQGVSKRFGAQDVLKHVSFEVREHEVLTVCGPSGGGKSTLLRCIVGLVPIDAGEIRVDGIPVDSQQRHLRQVRQRASLVFQEFNLYSHLNVLSNLTLAPIRVQKRPRREAVVQARDLLNRFGLLDKARAYPSQLSGGEKQRVAMARSLMLRPKVLLLDEVTSNLDPERVGEVLETVGQLAHDGMTLLLVTHHLGFARQIADRVAFLDRGELLELKPVETFFEAPEHPRARQFLRHAKMRADLGMSAEAIDLDRPLGR